MAFWSAGFACFWSVRFAHCWSGLRPSGAQALPASGAFALLTDGAFALLTAGAFALLTAGAAFGLLERRPCLLLERSLRSLLGWAIGLLEAAKRRSVKLSFLQKRQSRAPPESAANAPEGQRPLQQGAKRLLPKESKATLSFIVFSPEAAKPRSSRERSERPRRPKADPARSEATAPRTERLLPIQTKLALNPLSVSLSYS
ncbi:hypothetical protein SAMN02745866_02399 [Alteromonadaceae bacterium Bs31]|nr:hypothetical protein SAMN02745866_02399 [Alteromonadaceae bacterium Bs31]